MKIGYDEFSMKLKSIPESEPLYKIIKSRSVDLSSIKDKGERKYWRDLKRINAIPDMYLSNEEITNRLKEQVNGKKIR